LDHLVKSHTFDLALSGHGGLGGDPKIINDVTLGKIASEFSGDYQPSEKLSQLLEMQLHTLDEPARRKLVDQIQELLANELSALPLCYPTQYLAHNGQVNWFFTKGGVAKGVPTFFNKSALLPVASPTRSQ
jgi:peptide/nickel transport system substrate-binding protein